MIVEEIWKWEMGLNRLWRQREVEEVLIYYTLRHDKTRTHSKMKELTEERDKKGMTRN